jgi:hypothetical protein
MDLQLSVPVTTKVVCSNPAHGDVYSIQHYVTKLVSDLRQVGGFLRVLRFPPPMKTDRHDVVESGVKQHNPNPTPRVVFLIPSCGVLSGKKQQIIIL